MQACHACKRELDQQSLDAGRCIHCGAIVRKLSQRTIDDTRVAQHWQNRGDASDADPSKVTRDAADSESVPDDVTILLGMQGTIINPRDEDHGTPTEGNPGAPERKSPTVGDRSDQTMEFDPTPQTDGPGGGTSKKQPTHTFEKDLTVDLGLSAEDLANLDSQWRGTFELDSKQSHTIRQKETVTGFRSSLPVKSRYVRERRKGGAMPAQTPAEVPDYELLDIIGEGGMGVVYAAHQSSIARTVAVKMLKPSAKVRDQQRDKFISEAVVTGELDHPNIVPIYDLGANDEGALFYSMKRVRGTPWDKVIHQKQLDENLSILLRVADAVAFAHAGGVIHRDLKPENVMLGDFGEVLVMDWGLARITPEFAHADAVFQADSLGGTPAYMAPEMARGPIENINKTSDVYLLGALLYEIIGGQPPHSGRDVMQCLMAASQNKIDPIRYDGELKEIALKAMASRQEDRYPTVKDFQEAIQVYQSHSESLVLTAHANQNLQKARTTGDYTLFNRALYGFQESLTLWSDNHRARGLLTETQHDYAKRALDNGDFDLGASMLDANQPEHQALLKQINAARAERDARQRRLRLAKLAVAALLAGIVVTITVAYFFARAQRNKALVAQAGEAVARRQAENDRDAANKAKAEEEVARKAAVEDRIKAQNAEATATQAREKEEEQRIAAEKATEEAVIAKEGEEYERYVAEIGLINSKINDNAYVFARNRLDGSDPTRRNWEWGRLYYLTELDDATYPAAAAVQSVAYSPDGSAIVSGDMAGQVTVREAGTGKIRFQAPHGTYVLAVAFSPDGRQVASGSSDKTIKIFDANSGRVLHTLPPLHKDGVLTVRFSPDGRQLLSGSYDHRAILWDIASEKALDEFTGHDWWVWAAEFSPDGNRVVTAGQDGKAIVWQKAGLRPSETSTPVADGGSEPIKITSVNGLFEQLTQFTGHTGAVYAASFSPNGKLVATGGYDNLLMLWNPDEVQPANIDRIIKGNPEPKQNFLRLTGHDKPVRSVAFSPKGQLAISGSEDNSIRVWEVADGKFLKALRGHGGSVRSCMFSPDGQRLVSGGNDNSVRVWKLDGYQEVRVLHSTALVGHDDAVLSARFSRDGQRVVTASRDRTAALWDIKDGKPLRRFQEGHDFLVSSMAVFPDGKRLATGAGDNSVRIWDFAAGTQERELTSTGRIGMVAVSPDGRRVATGSPGPEVQLWDTTTGQPIARLQGHTKIVTALAFSPTGTLLASGDDKGDIRFWRRAGNSDNWQSERELLGHTGSINAIRFTPDGQRLITASADETCGQWLVATGEELRELSLPHDSVVTSLDLSPDGTQALTTSGDGLARLWRLADARQLASIKSPGTHFNAATFSPDASSALLTAFEDRRVWRWDVSAAAAATDPNASAANAGLLNLLLDFNKLGGEVWSASYAPDGQGILTIGGNDGQLWNVDKQVAVVRYSPHGAVASAAVSPNGKLVATGSWDFSAKIWDISSHKSIRKFDGKHTGYVNSVEFSPDGRELLTASDDGTARLWDIQSGAAKDTVFRHAKRITAASYSTDGSRILTVSGDKTACVWDRATGNSIATLTGHEWAVLCGQFSPDGNRVVTGSEDKTARIWDLSGQTETIVLEGHTAAINSVAFSPDGLRVLTGSQDNSAKLWDSNHNKEILSLPGHTQEVTSVSFSPDGLSVLTASRDGTAIIWQAKDWRESRQVGMIRPQVTRRP